jgi:cell division transport system permease protein
MKWNTVKYLCKEGLIGLWKNRLMALASAMTIVLCLLILGVSYATASNVEYILSSLESEIGITAYINGEVTDTRVLEIENEIKQFSGILAVNYITKDEALLSFAKDQGNDDLFVQFQQDNPLPASFEIKVAELENQQSIVEKLMQIPELQISYFEKETTMFMEINQMIQLISLVIISCLVCIALLLIVNTIKLTVYVRRREINIMKYIGATDAFIRLPFVIEGMIIGFLGCLIPTCVITVLYDKTALYINKVLTGITDTLTLCPFNDIMRGLLPLYGVLGIGIGILGSLIAIRKHLKV